MLGRGGGARKCGAVSDHGRERADVLWWGLEVQELLGKFYLRGCIFCLVLRLSVYSAIWSMKWCVRHGGICLLLLFSLRFPKEIHSGLLEVISPSPHFYPDFSHLRESFGDPKERVR